MKTISVAVDGPAGAGKSTISKLVAEALDLTYIDTGAMYRALTLKVLENKIDLNNKDQIEKLLLDTDISFKDNEIFLDGIPVEDKIRSNEVSRNVSNVAKIKEVRDVLSKLQRSIALKQNSIIDGRDIGTVVLPDAQFKFFITASPEERGRRRYLELLDKGEKNISLESIIDDIKIRDEIDSNREVAPLKKSKDAYEIDNTELDIEESVESIVKIIMEKENVL